MLTRIENERQRAALSEQIAEDLLNIGAVFLRPDEPFTWASGIKSPIYCDNRLTLSNVAVRRHVEDGLARLVMTHYPDCEALMGTSTAGIAHAALVADRLNLPMGYVRGDNKEHGRQNRIEGRLIPGQRVVVVEDLISTGGSVLDVVDALREGGAEVLGIVSIFTYGMSRSRKRLSAAGLVNESLCTFDDVVRYAGEHGIIAEAAIDRLLRFRNDPHDESWVK